jgi:hypothetical protein
MAPKAALPESRDCSSIFRLMAWLNFACLTSLSSFKDLKSVEKVLWKVSPLQWLQSLCQLGLLSPSTVSWQLVQVAIIMLKYCIKPRQVVL